MAAISFRTSLLALQFAFAGWTAAKPNSPESFVAAAPVAVAQPPAVPAPTALDTAKIHAIYLDGDFDQATRALEMHVKAKLPLSHADSVFVFKHLGVMYAANQATRDKGKYYMYQLIEIEPTARILDMYASDMIHLIFRNVQEDYETKHEKAMRLAAPAPAAAAPPAAQPTASAPAPKSSSRRKDDKTLYYWAAGGTAVAAGTIAVVLFLNSGATKTTKTIPVTP